MILLEETQSNRFDWMKHKQGDLIGGNTKRAIDLEDTQMERFDWMKHGISDLIGGNRNRAI